MKTREIRERVKAMGFERGVVYCMEAMNEKIIQQQRDLRELAAYFDNLVNSMQGVIAVAGRMKETIEGMQNPAEAELLGPNTNSLDKEE